jgi:hypothetical protein
VAQRDPRTRPYRVALWTLYLGVIALAGVIVISSIVSNLRGPHRPALTGALPTRAALRVCVTELVQMHRDLSTRAWKLGEEIGAPDAVARWQLWSADWEQRVDDLSDRCRLDASDPDPQGFGGREELRRARDEVLALHRAYRAQVNRFAQEEADRAARAKRALDQAQAALERQ